MNDRYELLNNFEYSVDSYVLYNNMGTRANDSVVKKQL